MKDPFDIHEDFRADFAELAKTCSDAGVPLLVRFTPCFSDVAEHSAKLRAWAASVEARFPGVTVGRPEVLLYDDGMSADGIHCNSVGAEKFTATVADEVRALLAGRRRDGSMASPKGPRGGDLGPRSIPLLLGSGTHGQGRLCASRPPKVILPPR